MSGGAEPAQIERVGARVGKAAAHWPGIQIDLSALDAGLRSWAAIREREAAEPADPSELFIAIACLADSKGAVRAFEDRYLDSAAGALHTYHLTSDEYDEVCQRMRLRLLVQRRGDTSVLLHYAGQGRIGGLVRVVLVREAMRLRSKTALPELPLEVFDDSPGPQRMLADDEHQTLLKAAFTHATAALQPRARTVLRLHYTRGVSGSQIGRMYGVHRGTAARWLAGARIDLLRRVHQYLLEHAPELDRWPANELRELVHSHLDLSLSRLLTD